MAKEEAAVLDALLKFFVVVTFVDVLVSVVEGLLEDIVLNVLKQLLNIIGDTVDRACFLLQCVATHNLKSSFLKIARTHNKAYRYTLKLVVGKLESWALVGSVVILNADALRAQLVDDRSELLCNGSQLLVALRYRNDNNLYRSELWRQHKTVVVRVGHDKSADKTCRYTP